MELKIYDPKEGGFLQTINWNYEELKAELQKKADYYANLVYTPDQIKVAKEEVAGLRKFVTALEDQRISVKKQVMHPYTKFEKEEKELIQILTKAINNIDAQIKESREAERQKKLEKVKEIYAKTIGGLADIVTFDKIFKDSWLNVSTSFKSITNDITEIRDKVDSDLLVINADTSPYAYEMKEEYLKNFDLTEAVNKKQQLEQTEKKKKLFEEQQKQKKAQRQQQLKEEAQKVVSAGESKEVLEEPIEAAKPKCTGERTVAITFRCVVKEHNFKEVNARLSLVQKVCEEFEIINPKEEEDL